MLRRPDPISPHPPRRATHAAELLTPFPPHRPSDGKAGKKAKPGAKGAKGKKDDKPGKPGAKGKIKGDYDDEDAFDDDKPGKASGGKTYGKKQKLGVSADAVTTKSEQHAGPKKRLKAVAAQMASEEHRPPPDLDALERAMQADAMKIDELRRSRESAVGEVKDAEKELLAVKTSVEDAEAVYNNVRSQPPGGYHHDHHQDHHDDHHDDAHHDDWDKFLDFGDEGAGDEGAGAKSPHRQPRHSQGAGAGQPRVSENDPVARAAAAARLTDPVQSPAAAVAMRDAANAAVRVASEPVHNPNHRSHLPSLHEAEQFLLQELKKLESANARLMSARAHLEVIDRQLAAAIASAAERSEQRVAMMRRNPALGGLVKKTWGGPPGARKIKEEIKEEEDDEEEEEEEEDDDDDGEAKERRKTTHRRNTAASAGGAPGGKVIEDRRFGIYDRRRYRMEGEPAPPDPSSDEDDEPKGGRSRGRAASAGTTASNKQGRKPPRVTPVSADAVSVGVAGRGRGGRAGAGGGRGRGRGRPPKNPTHVDSAEVVSTKAGTNLKRHQGFQFRGQNAAGTFVAPSAADAATYIAPSYVAARGLRWLMKRGRTRHAVARPASGPTSWAAMCSFALWKPAELKAAIAREKETETEANATDEEESDEDDDNGGGYDSEESGPLGSGHAHIDFDAFGYEMGDDGDMGMIMDMDFGEEFHPGLSP